MLSDDLSLLLQEKSSDPPFRQGVVISFNDATGENTIDVGGATLTNVPLLNIGDTVNIIPGDVVVLMKMRSAWAILGRVLIPGSSELSQSVTVVRQDGDITNDYNVTTTFTAIGTANFVIPTWANTADFFAIGQVSAFNSTAGFDFLAVRINPSGPGVSPSIATTAPPGEFVFCGTSSQIALTGPTIGGDPFSMDIEVRSQNANWGVTVGNESRISVIAIFTKE